MAKYKIQKHRERLQRFPSGDDIRLSPEQRLCAKFDPVSVATFQVSQEMAPEVRVVDNCAEEHIM